VIRSTTLRWVHLTSAGYTRYDRDDVRRALQARGAVMTNSSFVYADPCAQHLLAFMMAQARQLPSARNAHDLHNWNFAALRNRVRTLDADTSVLLVGYGAIAARLATLLVPMRVRVIGIRQRPRGDEAVPVYPVSQLDEHLPSADHVSIRCLRRRARLIFSMPIVSRS